MEENEKKEELVEEQTTALTEVSESETEPLDKNIKLMSPMRMVVNRFFRSRLSVIGLVMLVSLILFCWVGPVFYNTWGPEQRDETPKMEITQTLITYTDASGVEHTFYQLQEQVKKLNSLAPPSKSHPLGTDNSGMDVLARCMEGGKLSLTVSLMSVVCILFLGIVFGGIAGYFGGKIDNLIMRICDVLMCLPGFPIMLILGMLIDSSSFFETLKQDYGIGRIYPLMFFLTLFSWSGTARLVRGQILYLREQEYMVAAEAMGYSTGRKIFKHLIPNVLPQLIVSATMSLGSMILYEASLSYLGLGVSAPSPSWGNMIEVVSKHSGDIGFNVWGPPGLCIIVAVLGFNFVGDGLRDALDPKMKR